MTDQPPMPEPPVLWQGWKRCPGKGWQKVGAPIQNKLRCFEAMTWSGFAMGDDDMATQYIVLRDGEVPRSDDQRQRYQDRMMRPQR